FGAPDLRVVTLPDGSTSGVPRPSAATLPDGRIIVGSGSSDGAAWGLFGGGDPLDPSRWSKRGRLKDGWPDIDLSAGARGVFMVERTTAHIRKDITRFVPLWLRTFDLKRSRWGKA